MNTDKNFYIYTRSKKFHNYKRLNETGKFAYAFLWYLWKNNNEYFHRINSIKITSQGRPTDKVGKPHRKGKAVDFIIKPIEYMPYILGIISACTKFNLFLGTVTTIKGKQVKNLHIHFDNDYSIRKNTKFYESPDNKLYKFNKTNAEYILELYGFGFLESIQDFGKFKKDSIYYLTTYFPIGKKLKMSSVVRLPVKEKLKEVAEKYNFNLWLLAFLGLTTFYIYRKISPKKQEVIIRHGNLL